MVWQRTKREQRKTAAAAWSIEHPYWLAVKDPADTVSYWFHPMVFDEAQSTFTVEPHALPATVAAMVEQGVDLIVEVDALPAMGNPRVLFNRHGGASWLPSAS